MIDVVLDTVHQLIVGWGKIFIVFGIFIATEAVFYYVKNN